MIAAWTLAGWILVFLRTFGIEEADYFESVTAIDWPKEIVIGLFFGIVTGTAYSLLELLLDRPYFRRLSFGKFLLLKNFIYFLAAKLIFLSLVVFYILYMDLPLRGSDIITALSGKTFWVVLFYFLFISFNISFVLQVSQKFGPDALEFHDW